MDLKSISRQRECGFESRPGHQISVSQTSLNRRQALALAGGAFGGPAPDAAPAVVSAIISRAVKAGPEAWNTDWYGTMLIRGLLDWAPRGFPQNRDFAKSWLDYHLASKTLSRYSGARSRPEQVGGVAITTYAGHFGIAFPCYAMAVEMRDKRARRICLELAEMIACRTSRNRLGMVNHDDSADFAIPDTCYFVAPPLMMAAALEPGRAWAWRAHAICQLRTYVDTFLVRETGLAKTVLLKDGLGKTYWTRASGWLLWAIVATLRYLPERDPELPGFLADLRRLADGILRVQDPNGGFHVLLDETSTPLETTGTAMFAMGLHEAVRRGWLPESFSLAARKAWEFVLQNITPEGRIVHAYTGWALPAESHQMLMDRVEMGWIPGFVLSAAAEMVS